MNHVSHGPFFVGLHGDAELHGLRVGVQNPIVPEPEMT